MAAHKPVSTLSTLLSMVEALSPNAANGGDALSSLNCETLYPVLMAETDFSNVFNIHHAPSTTHLYSTQPPVTPSNALIRLLRLLRLYE